MGVATPAALRRDPSRVQVKVPISRLADYHIHIFPYFYNGMPERGVRK